MSVSIKEVSTTERFAIYDNEKIVSRLYIRDKDDGKPVYMFRLKTNVSHRNKGLAKEVIEKAIEKYSERGITLRACYQSGGPTVEALIKIYRKYGFKRKGKTNGMYIDPPKVYKVGDKTKLRCPNCNSFMRVASLPYSWTSHSAYGDAQHEISYTENGRKCKKCELEYLYNRYIKYKGFRIDYFDSIPELEQWIADIKAGNGKDVRSKGSRR